MNKLPSSSRAGTNATAENALERTPSVDPEHHLVVPNLAALTSVAILTTVQLAQFTGGHRSDGEQ
jgi:hypothetical protein